jgi:hypothetical protein
LSAHPIARLFTPPPLSLSYRIANDNDDKDNVIIDYVVCVYSSTGRKCAVQDLQIAVRARESSSSGRGVSCTEVKFVCLRKIWRAHSASVSHRYHYIYIYIYTYKSFSHHIPIRPSTWPATRPNIYTSQRGLSD